MQLILASDGNVSFVIVLYNIDQSDRPITFSFTKDGERQNFQLEYENKHIFRIDG